MSEFKIVYCTGQNCKIKNDCLRFRTDINRDIHAVLDYPPYDATKNECQKQLFKDGRNLDNFLDRVLNGISENGTTDRSI